MKRLLTATLAASLLGSVCAYAQSGPIADGPKVNPSALPGVEKIAGKKFMAADGSSMTLLAFDGGFAREIDTASGAVQVKIYALQGDGTGSVSESSDGDAVGSFRVSDSGILTEFNDGRTEKLISTGTGGVAMLSSDPAGEAECVVWYPEGHHFTASEREVALAGDAGSTGGLIEVSTASRSCSAPRGELREAKSAPRNAGRHVAAIATPHGRVRTAMTSPVLRGTSGPTTGFVATPVSTNPGDAHLSSPDM